MYNLVYYRRGRYLKCFDEYLDELDDAGIENVTLTKKMGDVDFLDPASVEVAAAVIASHTVNTPAMHGAFRGIFDLNSTNLTRTLIGHEKLLRHASRLGVKTYVVHSGSPVAGRDAAEERRCVHEALRGLLPVAEDVGIVIALENLPPNYVGHDPHDLVDTVQTINSPYLRLCFDSGHANLCGDAATYL